MSLDLKFREKKEYNTVELINTKLYYINNHGN